VVKLAREDIKTREILDWKGLHVFHMPLSSCSQKLRIFLALKGLEWESHEIDLMHNENLSEWFLGINPRGLVPVLVDNGDVHIESNDIITYLEKKYPEPKLIPAGMENQVDSLLKHENDLHLDLRALSFRFVFNPPEEPKSAEELARYATAGSGTVNGEKDDRKDIEIGFWKTFTAQGITDAVARSAAEKFRAEFDALDDRLADHPYLLGDELTVLDIAWFIYANRIALAHYPLARLHPRLNEWYEHLQARPEFAREIALPPPVAAHFGAGHQRDVEAGKTLELVAGW
jgi:glutathione S-transferase